MGNRASVALFAAVLLSSCGTGEKAGLPVISRGEEVVITEHLLPGKLTIVDFFADW
jgi:hypothetical protein